jgi:hypothetical protein
MELPTASVQFVFVNILSATRVVPLYLAFVAGLGFTVSPLTRRWGLWTIGCTVLVALGDS